MHWFKCDEDNLLPIQVFSTVLPEAFGLPDLQPCWGTHGVGTVLESECYLTELHYAMCLLIYSSRSVQMT